MPANRNIWNAADMAILVENYQTLGADYVAGQTGRPAYLVRAKAWRLGLSATGAEQWGEQELEQLRTHYPVEGADYVAELTGRPRAAVLTKAKRLGISCGQPAGRPRWSEAEDARMRADFATADLTQLSQQLGRNPHALRARAALLGLKRAKRPAVAPTPKAAAPTPTPKPTPTPTPTPKVAKTPKPAAVKKPVASAEEKALQKLVRDKAKAQRQQKAAKPAAAKKWWHYRMGSPEYEAGLATTTAGKQRTTILDENGRPATVWRKAA